MTALVQRQRHPWLDELLAAPDEAVDDLLRGVAHLPGLQRASPAEAAMALMGDVAQDEPEWADFDGALLRWLQERRAGTLRLLDRPGGAQRFIRETGEGFRMAWRLGLPQSKQWIHDHLGDLFRWADASFCLDPMFDLGRAVLHAGAHTQTGDEFRPLWFDVCEAAATKRQRHRLDCALLGLARMKTGHTVAGGPPPDLIGGLARWAAHLPVDGQFEKQSKQEVAREWRSIRGAFPRAPEFWRKQWRPLMTEGRDEDRPQFVAWLQEADADLRRPEREIKREPLLPKKAEVDDLERKIAEHGLTDVLWRAAETMLRQMERYAEFTGEARYLVKSSTRIADMILSVAPGCALDLMRRALIWAPSDGHAWSVRAKALAQLGKPDLAIAALWEGLRRIPSHTSLRHQLALLLGNTDTGHGLARAESIALLHKSINIDPKHQQSYPELARQLWLNGEADAAASLLQGHLQSERNNVSLYALALLLTAEGRMTEATRAVSDYRKLFGHDQQIDMVDGWIRAGTNGRAAAAEHFRDHWGEKKRKAGDSSLYVVWDALVRDRAMAGEEGDAPRLQRIADVAEADLLFGLGETGKAAAIDKVDRALTRDDSDPFAHLVKALALPEHRWTLEGQAGRFDGCLPLQLALLPDDRDASAKRRRDLAERFQESRPLIALTALARGQADGHDHDVLDRWSRSDSSWREGWQKFLKNRVRCYMNGDIGLAGIKPFAHEALTQAVDVPVIA